MLSREIIPSLRHLTGFEDGSASGRSPHCSISLLMGSKQRAGRWCKIGCFCRFKLYFWFQELSAIRPFLNGRYAVIPANLSGNDASLTDKRRIRFCFVFFSSISSIDSRPGSCALRTFGGESVERMTCGAKIAVHGSKGAFRGYYPSPAISHSCPLSM